MQKNIKRHKIKTLRSIHLVLFSIIILALINKFIKQFYVDKRKLDLLKVEFYKVFNLNPYGKSEKKVFFFIRNFLFRRSSSPLSGRMHKSPLPAVRSVFRCVAYLCGSVPVRQTDSPFTAACDPNML